MRGEIDVFFLFFSFLSFVSPLEILNKKLTHSLYFCALKTSSGYGRLEIVDFLLKKGADPRALNSAGQTPVDVATVNREMKAVKLLQRAIAEKESKEEVFV